MCVGGEGIWIPPTETGGHPEFGGIWEQNPEGDLGMEMRKGGKGVVTRVWREHLVSRAEPLGREGLGSDIRSERRDLESRKIWDPG